MVIEEGKKKLKMYYSSHLKESPEAISRWSRLLEEMDPNPKEILEAIILGIHTYMCLITW